MAARYVDDFANKENMEGYDVEFVDSSISTDEISCVICLNILREPMQAVPCGHRFCKYCIEKLKKQTPKQQLTCPNDRTVVQVFPDIGRQREILNMLVKCNNSQESCSWTGELRQLEVHLTTCTFQIVECPLGCNTKNLQRSKIHLCRGQNSRYSWLVRSFSIKIFDHVANECPNNSPCKYSVIGCVFQGTKDCLSSHLTDKIDYHLTLQMEHQEKIAIQNEQILARLEVKAVEQDQKIKELKAQLTKREIQIGDYIIAPKAPFTYVIENAKLEFYKAKHQNSICFSENFFCLSGYKARMKIYLNGSDSTRDKYISVYFQVMRGPFDDILKWPMPFQAISISLEINGNLTKQRILKCTESETVKSHFVKPANEFGKSRGFRNFHSIGDVPNDFKEDLMSFKVDVS